MKNIIAKMFKGQKRYSVNRKYALEQYGNIDLYVEGLESQEEIIKELEGFDKIVEAYREKEEKVKEEKINEPNQERAF